MKILFVYFDQTGAMCDASLRTLEGDKLKDMELWELFELHDVLITLGYQPISMTGPSGKPVHIITY